MKKEISSIFEKIKIINLSEGDVIEVTLNKTYKTEDIDKISDMIQSYFPKNKVLVLGKSVKDLKIIKKEKAYERDFI